MMSEPIIILLQQCSWLFSSLKPVQERKLLGCQFFPLDPVYLFIRFYKIERQIFSNTTTKHNNGQLILHFWQINICSKHPCNYHALSSLECFLSLHGTKIFYMKRYEKNISNVGTRKIFQFYTKHLIGSYIYSHRLSQSQSTFSFPIINRADRQIGRAHV